MEYATGTDIRQLENFPGQDKIGQTGADQDMAHYSRGMDPDRCPGSAWPHQLTVNTLISPETSGSRQSDTDPAINNRIHYTQQLSFNQPENEDYADSC